MSRFHGWLRRRFWWYAVILFLIVIPSWLLAASAQLVAEIVVFGLVGLFVLAGAVSGWIEWRAGRK